MSREMTNFLLEIRYPKWTADDKEKFRCWVSGIE